ncbi:MAG: hypothetical protein HZC36_00360 [Armatimonadetes bacterium]|nr:hypothetical protein [Armatimonadota bacterium]
MNSRERVRRAIRFECPDRIPFQHAIFPGALKRHGQALLELVAEFPDDFGNTAIIGGEKGQRDRGTEGQGDGRPGEGASQVEWYRDAWGSKWLRLEGYTAGEVVEPGLPDWADLGRYEFPPNTSKDALEDWGRRLTDSHEHWVNGGGGALFEQLQWIRGPENLYMDFAEDRPELHILADRLVAYFLAEIDGAIGAGVDGIGFADDWGSQRALLISPQQWRSFFKPRYARLFERAREAGKPVFFHTDGWTLDILPDLIEVGVDVLNPQHALMGEDRVAEMIGRERSPIAPERTERPRSVASQSSSPFALRPSPGVAIRSDLDRQHIIPHGTRAEIRAHVKAVVEAFATPAGGLILHGEIGQDVPLDNMRWMLEAIRDYGEA